QETGLFHLLSSPCRRTSHRHARAVQSLPVAAGRLLPVSRSKRESLARNQRTSLSLHRPTRHVPRSPQPARFQVRGPAAQIRAPHGSAVVSLRQGEPQDKALFGVWLPSPNRYRRPDEQGHWPRVTHNRCCTDCYAECWIAASAAYATIRNALESISCFKYF